MTDNPTTAITVITHYKKRLIHQQESETNEGVETPMEIVENGRDVDGEQRLNRRIKKKRKNCRGQFRHEGMELIKLGSNSSSPLYKNKEPLAIRTKSIAETNNSSVIQITPSHPRLPIPPAKPIPIYVHQLPQMVQERLPPVPPKETSSKVSVICTQYATSSEFRGEKRKFPYEINNNPSSDVIDLTLQADNPQCQCSNSANEEGPRDLSRFRFNPSMGFSENGRSPKIDGGEAVNLARRPPEAAFNPRPPTTEVAERPMEGGLPRLFLIKDLIAQGLKLQARPQDLPSVSEAPHLSPAPPKNGMSCLYERFTEPSKEHPKDVVNYKFYSNYHMTRPAIYNEHFANCKLKSDNIVAPKVLNIKFVNDANRRVYAPTDSRVVINDIVKPNSRQRHLPRPQPQRIERRQSVDSTSSGDSLLSPRTKNDLHKQVPQGKLFYLKQSNSFVRYFDDAQKKLFLHNVKTGEGGDGKLGDERSEVINLPPNAAFSGSEYLTVEGYVTEMTLVEKFIPKDFFLFYKFVTGYQICNNHSPVSFMTFLKVYNTNGLRGLLDKYIDNLRKRN